MHLTICLDAADPHRLAAFWAVALDWVVEDHAALVEQLLDAGVVPPEATRTVDGRLAWAAAAAVRDPAGPVDPRTGAGLAGRLLLQEVPEAHEPKAGKNRLHLDVHVGPERRDAHAATLLALGAVHLHDGEQGGHRWVTLADPEGNELCVA